MPTCSNISTSHCPEEAAACQVLFTKSALDIGWSLSVVPACLNCSNWRHRHIPVDAALTEARAPTVTIQYNTIQYNKSIYIALLALLKLAEPDKQAGQSVPAPGSAGQDRSKSQPVLAIEQLPWQSQQV